MELATAPWTPATDLVRPVTDTDLAAAFPVPQLVVVVDTEEEFDWRKPLSRANTSVRHIPAQRRAQSVFRSYGIVPTYVVDYPVAADAAAAAFFGDLVARGTAEVGAHLHPWVTPPHDESVTPRNSYPGNLPPALERAKLANLADVIEANVGVRPTVYKAGRYGFGPNTPGILKDLGFSVDCSMVARTSFAADGGPNYRGVCHRPAWLGEEPALLELPLTVGFAGRARRSGPRVFPVVAGKIGTRLHAPGVLARSGILERIRLSPEGTTVAELRRLTEALLADGCRVFCLAYHSPSLQPGHTPYVRSRTDLDAFLGTLHDYFHYFTRELGGEPATPGGIERALRPVLPAEAPLSVVERR